MIVLWIWYEGVLAVFRSLAWLLMVAGTVGFLHWSGSNRPLPGAWRRRAITAHLALTLLTPVGYAICFFTRSFLPWLEEIIFIKNEPFVGWSLIAWIGLHVRLRSETSAAYRIGLTILLLLAWYLIVYGLGAHSANGSVWIGSSPWGITFTSGRM